MAGSHDSAQWQRVTTDLTTAMAEWRAAHPRATVREMEAALDSWWAQVRARMLGFHPARPENVQRTSVCTHYSRIRVYV